jgi:malonate-semialdehyde dehydrogenase (acetylating)/methylmalonate-semialdehyde dehydrogenase
MKRFLMSATATPVSLKHWIGGCAEDATPDKFTEVTESATGEVITLVPHATAADVDRAVTTAEVAARSWRASSMAQRSTVLFAFRELMHQHRDELAATVTREHGKVLSDAAGEVQRGLEVVEFACGVGELLKGDMSGQVSRGIDSYSLKAPLGVVAGITPFNFPVMVPMWMVPIALACGNAFVLKPSDQDPSASMILARLLAEAGLPEGVFSVVHGDKVAVDAILEHDGVAAVSFVGSTPVARYVYGTATAQGKRVQALGGAKNHAVVLPDADLDLASDSLVSAGYGSAGQRCMAVSVAVAVDGVADELVEALASRIAELTVGDGIWSESEMGPLVSAGHLERVSGYIDAGVAEGATLLADGRGLKIVGREGGHFIGPSLFDRVSPGMSIYDEEIFGPVLLVVRVDTFDEAMALVNSSPFGNGAAIFTSDGGAARQFEQAVEAGMVGVNVPIPVPAAYHSFGGWKDSLFGDLHMYGPDGVRFYTRGKVITRRWADPTLRVMDLGFPTH